MNEQTIRDGQAWCQHGGCTEVGFVCSPPGDDGSLLEFYCPEHASQHGYCRVCGEFWGGISSFEVSGLCDHCADELADDGGDDEEFYVPDDWE